MAAKIPPKKAAEISVADFPALREFLRGYFHQDMNDDYGSPEGAARQFCRDTDAAQRKAVASEWERFLAWTKGQPLERINKLLTQELGSACTVSQSDLRKITGVFWRDDQY